MVCTGDLRNVAYLVTLTAGFIAMLAVILNAGGLSLKSRYVGIATSLYAITTFLLLALR